MFPQDEARSFEQSMARINVQLQKWNALSGAFSHGLAGNFKTAGESIVELHNPIYKLNSALIETRTNMKKMGVDMEQAMMNASMRATILVQRMEMLRARTMSLPRAFMARMQEGAKTESERIAASAGIMRSEYAKSIPEANRILSEVRRVVVSESAPLPGDTFTHLEVLSQTIDDSMKMAKDAGQTLDEAQKFAANVAGKIGAIGGTAGADQYSIIRFANALMSGSLSPRSRLDLVERNPAVKNAMKTVMRDRGVKRLGDLSKADRMDAIKDLLEKAMPQDQLDAASKTFEGTMEGFRTAMKNLFSFSRTLDEAAEGYTGPDITVFEEIKDVVVQLVNPLQKMVEALIKNPLTDPMTRLANGIGLLNGFFGNSLAGEKELEGMSTVDAIKQLGFIDFVQYMGANADRLITAQLSGERRKLGMNIRGDMNPIAGDVMSRMINALTVKFRMGVDGMFANLSQFIKNAEFINNLDIGGSIGIVMAELANSFIYLMNNILPILIQQTINMFAEFKKTINVGDLLNFLRLFGSFKGVWEQLQNKIAAIAEEAPKMLEKLTGGSTKMIGIFTGVGFAVATFGGFILFAGLQVRKFGEIIAEWGARKVGADDFADAISRSLDRTRQQLDNDNQPVNGVDQSLGFQGFLDRYRTTDETMKRFEILNPMTWLPNLGTGNQAGNALQRMSGSVQKLATPLMIAQMAGLPIPGELSGIAGTTGLGMGIVGNILSLMGRRGLSEEDAARQGRRGARWTRVFRGRVMQGDIAGARRGLSGMIDTNVGGLGVLFNGILKPLKGIVLKFAPMLAKFAPILVAIGANFWIIAGVFQMIIGILKRAYAASPELRRAVARFMNGMKVLFDQIGRWFVPLYKKYIQPLFKILGDLLAKWLNWGMDMWNKFAPIFGKRNDFSGESSRSASLEEAQQIRDERRFDRQERENEAIKKGRERAIYARFMGTPQIINAAAGFGQLDIPSLINAATMEAKMMPANESLILANTSETILTPEQMASTIAMSKSRANITIPKIDIMISAQSNQNPQMIANEVANVLMMKLENVQNMA